MNTSEIVARMCSKELGTADIKAICKARGFLSKEAKNRNFLENFILSDQGVAKAMDMLTQEEIVSSLNIMVN